MAGRKTEVAPQANKVETSPAVNGVAHSTLQQAAQEAMREAKAELEARSPEEQIRTFMALAGIPANAAFDKWRWFQEMMQERAFHDQVYVAAFAKMLEISSAPNTEALVELLKSHNVTARGFAERAVLLRRETIARDFGSQPLENTGNPNGQK